MKQLRGLFRVGFEERQVSEGLQDTEEYPQRQEYHFDQRANERPEFKYREDYKASGLQLDAKMSSRSLISKPFMKFGRLLF